MPRTKKIPVNDASGEIKTAYDSIQKKMGRVPNIFQQMAISPALLKGYLGLSEALNSTSFNPALREQIALVVGQANHCNYCLAAHSAAGKAQGLSDAEIDAAKKGESKVSKDAAILKFAKNIVEKKAHVTNEDVENLKKAGVSDREIVEIILVVISNVFTNYFNHIVDTEIDFPTSSKPLQEVSR